MVISALGLCYECYACSPPDSEIRCWTSPFHAAKGVSLFCVTLLKWFKDDVIQFLKAEIDRADAYRSSNPRDHCGHHYGTGARYILSSVLSQCDLDAFRLAVLCGDASSILLQCVPDVADNIVAMWATSLDHTVSLLDVHPESESVLNAVCVLVHVCEALEKCDGINLEVLRECLMRAAQVGKWWWW